MKPLAPRDRTAHLSRLGTSALMVLLGACALWTTPAADAASYGGGSYGGGGGSRGGGGSGLGGTQGRGSSRAISPGGAGRSATRSQPSPGPRLQPRDSSHLIPKSMRGGGGVRVPAGRDARADAGRLRRDPRLLDPYGSRYYGLASSPYHYMYLSVLEDDEPDDPIPPQKAPDESRTPAFVYGAGTVAVGFVLFWAWGRIGPRFRRSRRSAEVAEGRGSPRGDL